MNYTCDKVKELISPCIDGELSAEESELFFAHLSECAECKNEYEKLKKTVELIKEGALCPKRDLTQAVLASIRSSNRRSKLVRWGSTIAACFVLVICVSAFGVIEMMQKSADNAMEDSVNFAAYGDNGYADQEKAAEIAPSRTIESNTEAENYQYSADDDMTGKNSSTCPSLFDPEAEADVPEESSAETKADAFDYFASERYSDEEIKKYRIMYAPDFESPIGCVIVTKCDLPEISGAKLISFGADYETFVVNFTKFTLNELTSNLADNDVVELSSTVGDGEISFILCVKLK